MSHTKVISWHKRTIDSAKSLSIEYSVYDEMTLPERQVPVGVIFLPENFFFVKRVDIEQEW